MNEVKSILDMDKLVKSITIAISAIYEIYKIWKPD